MPDGTPVTRTNHDQLSVTSASGIYCMVYIYIYRYMSMARAFSDQNNSSV